MRVMVWRRVVVSPLAAGDSYIRSEDDAASYQCRTAYVRDGALTMVFDDGPEVVEQGIPLDTIAMYQIRKPIERPAPKPESGSGATAVYGAYALRELGRTE